METKNDMKPEGVRAWYERTTAKHRKVFMVASLVSGTIMALMWTCAPTATLMRLQSFNGALTIPLVGGLWIYMFIFMFLAPSREASFRGQEALERGIEFLKGAAEIWKKVGIDVERELPLMVKKVDATIEEVRVAVKKIEASSEKGSTFLAEAKPALDSLKAIEMRLEHEMNAGIMEDVRMAIDAVKMMMPPPVKPAGAGSKDAAPAYPDPDLGSALRVIGKKKAESISTQVKV